jgi:hypothetical protein
MITALPNVNDLANVRVEFFADTRDLLVDAYIANDEAEIIEVYERSGNEWLSLEEVDLSPEQWDNLFDLIHDSYNDGYIDENEVNEVNEVEAGIFLSEMDEY